jgi:hypothetical protein
MPDCILGIALVTEFAVTSEKRMPALERFEDVAIVGPRSPERFVALYEANDVQHECSVIAGDAGQQLSSLFFREAN